MYTETITQRLGIAAPAGTGPVVLGATGTSNSGKVDLSKFHRAFFLAATGTFGGTSPTFTSTLQLQDSPDGTTWTNNGSALTFNPSSTGPQEATIEIRADQLNAGARYARCVWSYTVGDVPPTV
jgi:hypothetical protein